MFRFALLLAVFSVSVLAGSAAAPASGDWPTWRGPNRDGISAETGLLKEWPAGGPPLVWNVKGVGTGYSSVSVVGGKIYTMGDGNEASAVHCLDVTNGKILWSTKVGKIGGNYPGTRSTPAVDGNIVVALGQFGDLVCLNKDTGAEIWRKNLDSEFKGRVMSGWNRAESPLIDGKFVVVTPGGPDGTMMALDRNTGAFVWRTKEWKDAAAYSSIVPVDFGGTRQYIQFTDASVAGVNAADGRVLWRADRSGKTAVIPTPVFHQGVVFVTSGYGIGCNAFKIGMNGAAFAAAQIYANTDMVNHHGGVVRIGEHIYGHSDRGGWRCMEMGTGKVLWSDKGVGKGAVTYADGHLYCRSEGGPGTVALVEASPAGYKEKGRFDQPDRSGKNSWAHPVIAGGKLYLRDMDVLLCYDVKAK